MLDVAEDDESARAASVSDLRELAAHALRTARDADAFLLQFLFEANVEVGHHEGVVRHEHRLIGDRFEFHDARTTEFA